MTNESTDQVFHPITITEFRLPKGAKHTTTFLVSKSIQIKFNRLTSLGYVLRLEVLRDGESLVWIEYDVSLPESWYDMALVSDYKSLQDAVVFLIEETYVKKVVLAARIHNIH